MTNTEFIEMKKGYIELVTNMITEAGGLAPHITVLGVQKKDEINAVVHIPIPAKYMDSDEMKDEFVDSVIPQISKEINKKFTVNAVAWASEAWLRIAPKDTTDLKNYKDLPVKKEVVIITIESADKNETVIMEIIRKGKQVTNEGDLVDSIELVELPEYEGGQPGNGRFTGLYGKFLPF